MDNHTREVVGKVATYFIDPTDLKFVEVNIGAKHLLTCITSLDSSDPDIVALELALRNDDVMRQHIPILDSTLKILERL